MPCRSCRPCVVSCSRLQWSPVLTGKLCPADHAGRVWSPAAVCSGLQWDFSSVIFCDFSTDLHFPIVWKFTNPLQNKVAFSDFSADFDFPLFGNEKIMPFCRSELKMILKFLDFSKWKKLNKVGRLAEKTNEKANEKANEKQKPLSKSQKCDVWSDSKTDLKIFQKKYWQ